MILLLLAMAILGLLLSAFFSGMETGLYRATRLRLVLDAMGGDAVARGLVFLANHPALFVATTLVGNCLANYLVSAAIVLASQHWFAGHAELAEVIGPLCVAPLLLVYGELLPKYLCLQAPNRLLRRGGPWLLLCVAIFFPISGGVWLLSRLLERLIGGAPEPARLVLARRELRRVLEEGHEAGILHRSQRQLAQGIFAVAQMPVGRYLLPEDQVFRARSDASKAELMRLAVERRASSIPIEDALRPGELIGYVRMIDLALSDATALGPVRPLLVIRHDSSHLAALMRLESANEILARVVNARGETVGLVTTERLREPLLD